MVGYKSKVEDRTNLFSFPQPAQHQLKLQLVFRQYNIVRRTIPQPLSEETSPNFAFEKMENLEYAEGT